MYVIGTTLADLICVYIYFCCLTPCIFVTMYGLHIGVPRGGIVGAIVGAIFGAIFGAILGFVFSALLLKLHKQRRNNQQGN